MFLCRHKIKFRYGLALLPLLFLLFLFLPIQVRASLVDVWQFNTENEQLSTINGYSLTSSNIASYNYSPSLFFYDSQYHNGYITTGSFGSNLYVITGLNGSTVESWGGYAYSFWAKADPAYYNHWTSWLALPLFNGDHTNSANRVKDFAFKLNDNGAPTDAPVCSAYGGCSSGFYDTNINLMDNTYHFFVFVIEKTGAKLYLDGEPYYYWNGNNTINFNDLTFDRVVYDLYSDGSIKQITDFAVYNIPLSEEQVFNIFDSGKSVADFSFDSQELTISEVQYNPATGNVFLAGACEKKGSGINQMDLTASIDFDPENPTDYTEVDPLRGSLITCLDNGTWTGVYNGTGLTGTTTIIIDDTFFGTELATTEVIFYDSTGYINFNFGDRVEFLTNNASGTPVNLDFNYSVCDDPEYSATSSYIYLCADALGEEGEIIHQCEQTNPKTLIETCSGIGTISFTFPYNTIYTGRAYFAYANSYGTITITSDYFYIVARPSGIYGMPECSPPSYSLTDICSGIDTSNLLGDLKCGVKYAVVASGQFLFYPSCDSLESIGNAYYNFKRSFPFNTFFDLTDAIDTSIQTAMTSTSTPNAFAIPFIRQTATSSEFYMLNMMSSTTMADTIGETNYNTYKTTLGFVWWILVAVIVFFTIRKV